MEKGKKTKREVLPAELTVAFDYPVSIKSEDVSELMIRKPKMKQILAQQKVTGTDMDREFWIISAVTGATISDLEELDIDQYALIQEQWGKYVSPRGVNV